jgi:hypothetical protein
MLLSYCCRLIERNLKRANIVVERFVGNDEMIYYAKIFFYVNFLKRFIWKVPQVCLHLIGLFLVV